jgi:hypothetical protein
MPRAPPGATPNPSPGAAGSAAAGPLELPRRGLDRGQAAPPAQLAPREAACAELAAREQAMPASWPASCTRAHARSRPCLATADAHACPASHSVPITRLRPSGVRPILAGNAAGFGLSGAHPLQLRCGEETVQGRTWAPLSSVAGPQRPPPRAGSPSLPVIPGLICALGEGIGRIDGGLGLASSPAIRLAW